MCLRHHCDVQIHQIHELEWHKQLVRESVWHVDLGLCRMLPDPPRGAVILLDRGVVDNVAYCTEAALVARFVDSACRLEASWKHLFQLLDLLFVGQEAWSMVQEKPFGCNGMLHIWGFCRKWQRV